MTDEKITRWLVVAVAVLNFGTAGMGLNTCRDVAEVKKQTNHIKDQLVESTAEASHSKGMAEGRIERREEEKIEDEKEKQESKAP